MISVNFIIAQILGFVATLALCSSYLAKSKKGYLLFSILGDIVYGLSFVFVDALGTGIITILSCLQSIAFYLFERKGKVMPKWIAAMFAATFIVVGTVTATSVLDIIPIATYVWFTFTLYAKNMDKLKLLSVLPNAILVVYDIAVTAYASAFEDGFEATFLAVIIVTDYAKSLKIKKDSRNCATLKSNSKPNWILGAYKSLQSAKLDFETSDECNDSYDYNSPVPLTYKNGRPKCPI